MIDRKETCRCNSLEESRLIIVCFRELFPRKSFSFDRIYVSTELGSLLFDRQIEMSLKSWQREEHQMINELQQ